MIYMADKIIFVIETGRENMAKLMANIGMATKMKEYEKNMKIEMIFLTPAVSVLNKDQALYRPILDTVWKAKNTGIKIIACETAMSNVGLTREKIPDNLVDEFAPIGGIYVLNKIKEDYETFWI
ncbi:hypothetical protein TZ01_08345 [Acidiplasma sp. MBA-1]|uniref:Uncharacterized protein n=2 Tax=Ferroplasmaceae TaxID=90142 RepID=A0A0Q1B430_9ARCH|nr:hypothetical protein TZ01_08345 [Acidiplasma sp. MBA-1]KQB34646.1 hypothetical protein AOG54_04170 [Acidiplasma aeolicum]